MSQKHKDILIQLEAALKSLLIILDQDSRCPWTSHFASCQRTALHLLDRGFSQDSLKDLSRSIHSVYRGVSSFSDYSPAIYNSTNQSFTLLRGAKDFPVISQTIFDLALSLRQRDSD